MMDSEIQKSAAIAQREFWNATTEDNIDSIMNSLNSVEKIDYFFKTIDFNFVELSHLQQNCLITLNSSAHKSVLRKKNNINSAPIEKPKKSIGAEQKETPAEPDYQKIAKDYIKTADEKEEEKAANGVFVIPLLLVAGFLGYILPSPFGVYGFFGVLFLGCVMAGNRVSK